jgi:hypothetical protein
MPSRNRSRDSAAGGREEDGEMFDAFRGVDGLHPRETRNRQPSRLPQRGWLLHFGATRNPW